MDSRALERDLKKAIEFGKRSREWVDISVSQGKDAAEYVYWHWQSAEES